MVKTPACHAGDEGIVTPTGRHLLEKTMNRGSALKWCELLRSNKYLLNDGVGLHWWNYSQIDRAISKNEPHYFSPCGVLEDFISGEWPKLGMGLVYNKDSNAHYPSAFTLKKVKAKTNLSDMVDETFLRLKLRKNSNPTETICRFISLYHKYL
jgi:hypothetical protein